MGLRWRFRPPDAARSRALAERLSVSPIMAQLLLNRGIEGDEAAARFLAPDLRQLYDPFLFRDMRRAAERILAAVKGGEGILIYGDYDVDGATATALLYRLLRALGARVSIFIPDRVRDGYGMRAGRLAEAAEGGARVVIAVDNGTTAFEAAEEARRAGIDLIVADHHDPGEGDGGAAPRLPRVFALLNPRVPGESYPFPDLCGCGVAFKLAWAVAQLLSPGTRVSPAMRELLIEALSLVAIGTIADVVPLVGENRILATFGLKSLAATRNRGLRALLRAARIESTPGAEDVAFRIAPRLNAAGRLGDASRVIDLLAAEDEARAEGIARFLEGENRRRRGIEQRILEEALPRAEAALEAANGRALVLADRGWHLGVLGIVASRLVERFHRPAVLIALEGERGRGSARSVPGIALPRALARCREDLIAFGGHDAAAGLEIRADRVERFRERLSEALAAARPDAGPAEAAPLEVDLDVRLEACSRGLVDEIARLGPHGCGNGPPVFAARAVELVAPPRVVGHNGAHLQLLVREGRSVFRAIGFGLGGWAASLARAAGPFAIAFRPFLSRWQGEGAIEIQILDIRCGSSP